MIRNQQVTSSSLVAGSTIFGNLLRLASKGSQDGRFPSRSRRAGGPLSVEIGGGILNRDIHREPSIIDCCCRAVDLGSESAVPEGFRHQHSGRSACSSRITFNPQDSAGRCLVHGAIMIAASTHIHKKPGAGPRRRGTAGLAVDAAAMAGGPRVEWAPSHGRQPPGRRTPLRRYR